MIRMDYLPEVQPEIREAFRYYERQRKGLGRRFRDDIKAVLARIRRMPMIVAPIEKDVRGVVAEHFPYVVYYRVLTDVILVIAVLHGSRDPDVWRLRN